jgi:rRNA-processing protein FCF1
MHVHVVVQPDSLTCVVVLAGTPCITDCVMAELEKLGQRYRVALR